MGHIDISSTINQTSGRDEPSPSNGASEKTSEAMNPLFLHPVLIRIFDCLNVHDLLQSKLVCKQWSNSANLALSKRLPNVRITLTNSTESETLLNITTLKFQSFYLFNFSPNLKFLNEYGTNITRLLLNFDYEVKLSELLMSTPYLKSLEISSLPRNILEQSIFGDNDFSLPFLKSLSLHYRFRNTNYSNLFLNDIIKMSPNLKQLKLNREIDYGDQTEELKVFQYIAQYKIDLEYLELSLVLNELLRSLRNILPRTFLKSFICKQLDQINSEHLQTFLETQKRSLVHLGIGLSRCSGLRVQFPVMEKLEVLSLCFHHFYGSDIPSFGTLVYGEMFPKLKTLKTSVFPTYSTGKYAYVPDEIFPSNLSSCKTLEYLQLPENLDKAEWILNAAILFPNIKKLNLASQNNPQVLMELWKSPWSKTVEIMNISLSPDLPYIQADCVMTGISETSLQPNLSLNNFSDLKLLIISCGPLLGESSGNMKSKISDSTVENALVKIKSLRRLIVEHKAAVISQSSIELLFTALGLKQLPFNIYGKNISGFALEFSKYEWRMLKNSSLSKLNFDIL